MSGLTIELPSRADQMRFNLLRWDEVCRDGNFARVEGRIETDRHGNVVMSPPPSRFHSSFQSRILGWFIRTMPEGEALAECPISTADGVRAVDVAWLSAERSEATADQACLETAPEICVEVRSPSNTDQELREKTTLYFDAGAAEVWWCEADGRMRFFLAPDREDSRSERCPDFPKKWGN